MIWKGQTYLNNKKKNIQTALPSSHPSEAPNLLKHIQSLAVQLGLRVHEPFSFGVFSFLFWIRFSSKAKPTCQATLYHCDFPRQIYTSWNRAKLNKGLLVCTYSLLFQLTIWSLRAWKHKLFCEKKTKLQQTTSQKSWTSSELGGVSPTSCNHRGEKKSPQTSFLNLLKKPRQKNIQNLNKDSPRSRSIRPKIISFALKQSLAFLRFKLLRPKDTTCHLHMRCIA